MYAALKRQLSRVPAKVYAWGSVIFVLAGLTLLVWATVLSPTSIGVWVSPLIALAAVTVAVLSRMQARRSADAAETNAKIAELQEQRRRFGWVIEPHPSGSQHLLRNVGTVPATQVELGEKEQFAWIGFVTSPDSSVNIAPGEARAFVAAGKFGALGVEVCVRWVPEGEQEPREWIEVLDKSGDSAQVERRSDELRQDRIREEQRRYDEKKDIRGLILQLGEAYEAYRANRDDAGKRLRVQLLVAALPPDMAREIGYEVDVARDVWGPGEYPLIEHVAAEDAHLVQEVLPQVELMWNMRTLTGFRVYGPISADGPNTEPRIWWAIQGYVDRIKERESGERVLRRSVFDQRHHDEAMAHIADARRRWASTSGDEPNNLDVDSDFDAVD